MPAHFRKTGILCIAATFMLAACGGKLPSSKTEPDPPPVTLPTTTISGVFDGQIPGTGQPLTSVLQVDGSYYLIYSNASNGNPAGAVLGTGTLTGTDFTSSNGLDMSLVGSGTQTATPVTVKATFNASQSFNGTLTYPAPKGAQTFSGTFNSTYKQLPSFAELAGTYTGSIATKDVKEDYLQLIISSDGTVSGKLSCGCSIQATLTPRADGTSYAAGLSFKGGEHPLSNKSMGGNVYYDAARKRLYIVGMLSASSDGAIFVGTKP